MSEEILINITPHETRVAVVENGILQEIHIERGSNRGLVGNIYKGRVMRVLPGMQAAFIDIGLERAAFLHVSDLTAHIEDETPKVEQEVYNITQHLKEGQELVVQVIKDPVGRKGARLTTQLSIPSRNLVYLPYMSHIGVSQRIEDEQERTRLKQLILDEVSEEHAGGYIIRTAAEGVISLTENKKYIDKLWNKIKIRINEIKCGSLIHEDLPLFLRALRDLVTPDTTKIRVDDFKVNQSLSDFIDNFIPDLKGKLEYYQSERALFDLYGVEDEIHKALQSKVMLKSGGYLVIDQTEAMTTIDVNTGAFVGHHNLEETIFKTNLEAAVAIARQLRLRNLGGIIIIDFIDMIEEEHKRQVIRMLDKSLTKDHAKHTFSEVSSLGLVQMTRKRTTKSLEHTLCEPCSLCDGRGYLKTSETVCHEIIREILRAAKTYESATSLLVLASQSVVERFLDEESSTIAEVEDIIGKLIKLQVETFYSQEQYDVVLR